MELAVNALRALADPVRLRILRLLKKRSLCVCQIAAVVGVPYASLSKHLHLLKYTGLVVDHKQGRWVYYSIPDESWNPHVPALLALLESMAGSEEIFKEDEGKAKRVSCCDLTEVAKFGARFFAAGKRKQGAVV